MSLSWGSWDYRKAQRQRIRELDRVRPILPSRIWRGVCWALAIEAGAWAVVWFVLRHSSLWVRR